MRNEAMDFSIDPRHAELRDQVQVYRTRPALL